MNQWLLCFVYLSISSSLARAISVQGLVHWCRSSGRGSSLPFTRRPSRPLSAFYTPSSVVAGRCVCVVVLYQETFVTPSPSLSSPPSSPTLFPSIPPSLFPTLSFSHPLFFPPSFPFSHPFHSTLPCSKTVRNFSQCC